MKYTTYILYSAEQENYYTGYTSVGIEERLKKHKSNHKGFTGKTDDWKVVYQKSFEDKKEALKLEKQIKGRGAKRYIKDQGIL